MPPHNASIHIDFYQNPFIKKGSREKKKTKFRSFIGRRKVVKGFFL